MNNANDKDKKDRYEYLLESGEENGSELPIRIDIDLEYEEIKKSSLGRVLVSIACSFAVLIVVLSLVWMIFAKREYTENLDTLNETQTDGEWRGAFLDRSVYDSCIASSAVIRIERGSGGCFWSGFVFDENGWIATSLEGVDRGQKGRIYVILGSGEQYVVESILADNESSLALLKINAEGLSTVNIGDRDVQGGEALVSVGASSDNSCYVRSGEVARARGDELILNMGWDTKCAGSAIFDEYGNLVAVATGAQSEDDIGLTSAISAQKAAEILARMRGSQN